MTDDELDAALAALASHSPADDFEDRVMARVSVQPVADSPVATPRPMLAVAASLALVVAGSMAASIVWAMRHYATLTALGQEITARIGAWLWDGMQLTAGIIARQAELGVLRIIVTHPVHTMAILALGSALYLGGILALRRLLTTPTPRMVYAQH